MRSKYLNKGSKRSESNEIKDHIQLETTSLLRVKPKQDIHSLTSEKESEEGNHGSRIQQPQRNERRMQCRRVKVKSNRE
ncbi:hypothetical protein BKA69DRAFT_1044994 [Paraphysoderma sedebokerense]|nr:hypothetical protein BKA69DRAFT_1044994 [Paraphysoderma sedebokerense]